MTSILLTGASGFIGFHTAVRLCGEGYKVFAPIRSGALQSDNVQKLKSKGVRIIEGGVRRTGRVSAKTKLRDKLSDFTTKNLHTII